jgi:2-polyprenyl-3-methyl-5-hydroxy-6-metoxy-1,4-benzoquinol methylase
MHALPVVATNPRTYWASRLEGGGMSQVGRIGLSDELNAVMYTVIRRHALAMLRAAGVRTHGRALDAGSGWGFWFRTWQELGFPVVDAVDFVEESVARVRAHARPADDVRVADITAPRIFEGRQRYDLVSCMNVLLHVVHPGQFGMALANVASAVAPGGLLLLAEPAAVGPISPADGADLSSRVHALDDYLGPMSVAGLELVDLRPAMAITGDPVERRGPVARHAQRLWWRGVLAADRRVPTLRGALGAAMQVVDQAARRLGAAETSKLVLFRKTWSAAETGV